MYSLYAHVPEFLLLYQNLEYYTQQGMEKYNNTVSKDYLRSSDHRGVSALIICYACGICFLYTVFKESFSKILLQ